MVGELLTDNGVDGEAGDDRHNSKLRIYLRALTASSRSELTHTDARLTLSRNIHTNPCKPHWVRVLHGRKTRVVFMLFSCGFIYRGCPTADLRQGYERIALAVHARAGGMKR